MRSLALSGRLSWTSCRSSVSTRRALQRYSIAGRRQRRWRRRARCWGAGHLLAARSVRPGAVVRGLPAPPVRGRFRASPVRFLRGAGPGVAASGLSARPPPGLPRFARGRSPAGSPSRGSRVSRGPPVRAVHLSRRAAPALGGSSGPPFRARSTERIRRLTRSSAQMAASPQRGPTRAGRRRAPEVRARPCSRLSVDRAPPRRLLARGALGVDLGRRSMCLWWARFALLRSSRRRSRPHRRRRVGPPSRPRQRSQRRVSRAVASRRTQLRSALRLPPRSRAASEAAPRITHPTATRIEVGGCTPHPRVSEPESATKP